MSDMCLIANEITCCGSFTTHSEFRHVIDASASFLSANFSTASFVAGDTRYESGVLVNLAYTSANNAVKNERMPLATLKLLSLNDDVDCLISTKKAGMTSRISSALLF